MYIRYKAWLHLPALSNYIVLMVTKSTGNYKQDGDMREARALCGQV